jgi:hypothetical protein
VAGPVRISILADASRAVAAFKDTSAAATTMGHKVDAAGKTVETSGKRFGKLRAAGLAAGGALGLLGGFVKSSSARFAEMVKATAGLQRSMGGTAESASRWAFVAKQSGVDTDVFAKSTAILSKHLVANDDAFKALGVSGRDSHGNLKSMDELLPQLADKFAGMPNGPKKTALALKVFGKAGLGMLPILNKGSKGILAMRLQSDKLGNTLSGAQVEAFKKNTAAQRLFTATMDGIKVKVGAGVLPVLTLFAKFLTKLSATMTAHATTAKAVAGALAAVAVALLSMMAITKVVNVVKGFTAAMKLLNLTFLTNPIFLVIAIIAALVIGLVIAYKKSETFRKIVDAAFRAVKAVVNAVVGWFVRFVPAAWDKVSRFTATAFGKVQAVFAAVFGWIKRNWPYLVAMLAGPVGLAAVWIFRHWAKVTAFFRGIPGWFADLGRRMLRALTDGISAGFGWVTGRLGALRDAIMRSLASAGLWLVNAGRMLLHGLTAGIGFGIAWVLDRLRTLHQRISQSLASAGTWAVNAGRALLAGMANGVAGGVGWVLQRLWSLHQAISGSLASAGSWLVGAGRALMTGLANAVAGGVGWVVGQVRGIPGAVVGVFGNAGHILWDVGLAIVRGLGGGVHAMVGWVVDQVRGLASAVVSAIRKLLGIGSPSKVTAALGRQVTAGLGQGILAAVPALKRDLARVAGVVADGLSAAPTVGLGAAGSRSGATAVTVNVNVPVTADPAEVGRQVVKALQAYSTAVARPVVITP